MDAERMIAEQRGHLFGIAYRMLGQVGEAEDALQDAFLRWAQADRSDIENPAAWLTTVVTRICLDRLKSAQRQRETYVGPWLPEPLVADATGDPADQAEMADSLSIAFLVLLESLSPEERAVLLLRDVFDYGYDEIASIVGKSESNARQLAARARRRVGERRPRFESSREQRDKLASRFLAAAEEGDLGALESLLAHDVVLHADGGGKVPAIARSLVGRSRVARAMVAWVRRGVKVPGTAVRPTEVNGQPGAFLIDGDGKLVGVVALDIAGQQVRSVVGIVNPDKLQHLGPVGDLGALLRRSLPRDARPTEPSTNKEGGNR